MEQQQHMFTNRMIRNLLIPVVLEQLLNSIMGTADTMMVSNVGSAAISAVSLVDSINVLVIQAFSALAAGGAIVCAQYIGQRNKEKANESARQVLFIITAISVAVSLFCLVFQKPLLRLIFGSVEEKVMRASEIYFFYTALSFPFIAAYDSAASIFRAQDNTRGPMTISMISNVMNIAGNAIMIWAFHMGVAGAALSTLISRIFCAVVVLIQLRKEREGQEIVVRDYFKIRPNWSMIKRILGIGIPSGVENSMFQLGKLAIQSTVSTLGTAAIAAQAMTNILENLNGIAAIGVGVGLMTIVGQCLGAGRKDEAVYYIKKLCVIAEIVVLTSCLIVFALTKPVTILGGMESADMCFHMVMWITIMKPLVWTMAFVPGYGLRAAGDVKFSMITSCCTMWACRFCLCVFLIRVMGFGPMGVWIGMFADWTVRSIIFTWRFHSRKWLQHKVI